MQEVLVATLPDGRAVSYDVVGDDDGLAVFYFHGAGDSRLSRPPGEDFARNAGVRLVCLDRPGYGRSGLAPGRTLLSWADDVAAVADLLDVDDFAVIGWSAGGAYAFACASAMPSRVSACAVYGSVVPTTMPGSDEDLDEMARRVKAGAQERPEELRQTLNALAADPVGFGLGVIRGEEGGNELLAVEAILQQLTSSAGEAFAQGGDAMTDDFILLYGPWGFDLATVTCPTVVASGELDRYSPPTWGRWLADQLPHGRFMAFPDRNHYGFVQEPVLTALLQAFA